MRIVQIIIFLVLIPICSLGQQPKLVVPVGATSEIIDVLFTPDGHYLLTASGHNILLWEVSSGKTLHTFRGHSENIDDLAIDPSGQLLLSGSWDGTVRLWDIRSGTQLFSFATNAEMVKAVGFTPDGRYAVGGDHNGKIWLWEVKTKKLSKTFSRQIQAINTLAISPDSRYLLAGGYNAKAELWDINTGEVRLLSNQEEHITYATFSPDNKTVAAINSKMTVYIWNTSAGTLKQSLELSTSTDNFGFASNKTLAYAPNGNQLAVLRSDQPASVYDISSGALVVPLEGNDKLYTIAYSSKGNRIIAGGQGLSIIWDANTGKLLQKLITKPDKTVSTIAFSPDGNQLLEGTQLGDLTLFETASGSIIRSFQGFSTSINDLTFSPDGQQLLMANGDQRARLWDSKNGQLITTFDKHTEEVLQVAFSKDGKKILTVPYTDSIRVWDAQTGQPLLAFKEDSDLINSGVFSPDGRYVAIGTIDNKAKLIELQNGTLVRTFEGHRFGVSSVNFSPDGQHLLTTSRDGTARIWDWQTGQLLDSLIGHEEFGIEAAVYSPDGKYILTGATDKTAKLWDSQTGELIRTYTGFKSWVIALAFSPDGQYVILGGLDNSCQLWQIDGTQPLHLFEGHNGGITDIVFSPDGSYCITSSYDNSIKFWSMDTREEVGTLIPLYTNGWAVTSPIGLFDASQDAMQSMHYTLGTPAGWETIELDQLKNRYYEPGLFAKLLGFSDERIRPVEGFKEVALYPKVTAKIVQDELQVQLEARSGGIGKVSIFINGKEVAEDANPLPEAPNAQRASNLHYDLKTYSNFYFRHPDSTNRVTIQAYNAEGWLKSQDITLEYKFAFSNSKGTGSGDQTAAWEAKLYPKLYVISIGSSNYTGTELDLQFADQDATVMAKALQSVGSALYANGDSVEVYCLTTASDDNNGLEDTPIEWKFATKANIQSTFELVQQKAKAEDVLLVYLSGHGMTYASGDEAQFFYLTQGIANDDLSDSYIRNQYTISSEEITGWINKVPALKQVLVIDACNSGKVIESFTSSTRSLNTSQIRALDRMKDRTGMFILSGSAADKVSYEASEYGQGLLTYALLQGMLGVATRPTADGDYIDVMKLFQYARDEVPRLAASINGIQRPMMGFPNQAASFDIGIFNEQVTIPVNTKKPVVIRSNFMNEATLRDDLNLEQLLEQEFRYETEEGKDADLIYVDVNEYPGAFSISGLYKKTGTNIEIRIKLFEGGTNPVDLKVNPTDDPERLVRYIVRALKQALENKGF